MKIYTKKKAQSTEYLLKEIAKYKINNLGDIRLFIYNIASKVNVSEHLINGLILDSMQRFPQSFIENWKIYVTDEYGLKGFSEKGAFEKIGEALGEWYQSFYKEPTEEESTVPGFEFRYEQKPETIYKEKELSTETLLTSPYADLFRSYTVDEIWEIARGKKIDVTTEEIEQAKEVITKGLIAFKQMGLRRYAYINNIGQIWEGEAWRAESDLMIRGNTAQEIVNFEAEELGNIDIKQQAESFGIDLTKIPEKYVVWVTRTKEDALHYGDPELYDIPDGSIILADDEEGGYLVLKNIDSLVDNLKYKKAALDVMDIAPGIIENNTLTDIFEPSVEFIENLRFKKEKVKEDQEHKYDAFKKPFEMKYEKGLKNTIRKNIEEQFIIPQQLKLRFDKIAQIEDFDVKPQVTKQELKRLYRQEVKGLYDEELEDEIISKFLETLMEMVDWDKRKIKSADFDFDEQEKEIKVNLGSEEELVRILQSARTPQEKMIAIDQVINTVHLYGVYGEYLIKDANSLFFDELSSLKVSSLNFKKTAQIEKSSDKKLWQMTRDEFREYQEQFLTAEGKPDLDRRAKAIKERELETEETIFSIVKEHPGITTSGLEELTGIPLGRLGGGIRSLEEKGIFNIIEGKMTPNGLQPFTYYIVEDSSKESLLNLNLRKKAQIQEYKVGDEVEFNTTRYYEALKESPGGILKGTGVIKKKNEDGTYSVEIQEVTNIADALKNAFNPGRIQRFLPDEFKPTKKEVIKPVEKAIPTEPKVEEVQPKEKIKKEVLVEEPKKEVPKEVEEEIPIPIEEFKSPEIKEETPTKEFSDPEVAFEPSPTILEGEGLFEKEKKEKPFWQQLVDEVWKGITTPVSWKKPLGNVLSLKKYAQIDRQLFFDFYGVSLLSDQYLDANPYAKEYKDMIVQQVKDEYVPLITKMVYAELSKNVDQVYYHKLIGNWRSNVKDLTLEQLAEVYYEGNWEENYGGSSWGNIVDSLIELINTTDTNQLITIIDHINDIEHNTGLMFHDFPKVKEWFSDALDVKAKTTPEQLIPYLSPDIQKFIVEDLHLKGEEVVTYVTDLQRAEQSKNPEELKELSKCNSWRVHIAVVENTFTSVETLIYLFQSNNINVWWALLDNPITPPEIINELEERLRNLNLRKKASIEKHEIDFKEKHRDKIPTYTFFDYQETLREPLMLFNCDLCRSTITLTPEEVEVNQSRIKGLPIDWKQEISKISSLSLKKKSQIELTPEENMFVNNFVKQFEHFHNAEEIYEDLKSEKIFISDLIKHLEEDLKVLSDRSIFIAFAICDQLKKDFEKLTSLRFGVKKKKIKEPEPTQSQVTKQELINLYKQEAKGIYDEEAIDAVIAEFIRVLENAIAWEKYNTEQDEMQVLHSIEEFEYTDLEYMLNLAQSAHTLQEKMIAIDQIIHKEHQNGYYGEYLITGIKSEEFEFFENLHILGEPKISNLNFRKKAEVIIDRTPVNDAGSWAIYDGDVYITYDENKYHIRWFEELGLPTSGEKYDNIVRGYFKDDYIVWYGTGTFNEFYDHLKELKNALGYSEDAEVRKMDYNVQEFTILAMRKESTVPNPILKQLDYPHSWNQKKKKEKETKALNLRKTSQNKLTPQELLCFYKLEEKGLLTNEIVDDIISKLIYGLKDYTNSAAIRGDIKNLENSYKLPLMSKIIEVDQYIHLYHMDMMPAFMEGDPGEINKALEDIFWGKKASTVSEPIPNDSLSESQGEHPEGMVYFQGKDRWEDREADQGFDIPYPQKQRINRDPWLWGDNPVSEQTMIGSLNLRKKFAQTNLWAIYEGKIYIFPFAGSHISAFEKAGLPTSGTAFDQVARGFSMKDKDKIIWYENPEVEEEVFEKLPELIEQLNISEEGTLVIYPYGNILTSKIPLKDILQTATINLKLNMRKTSVLTDNISEMPENFVCEDKTNLKLRRVNPPRHDKNDSIVEHNLDPHIDMASLNFKKKIAQEDNPKEYNLKEDNPRRSHVTRQELINLYKQEVRGIYDEEAIDAVIAEFIRVAEEWTKYYMREIEDESERGCSTSLEQHNVADFIEIVGILQATQTPQEKMIAVDRVINMIHSYGRYVDYFIDGASELFLTELSNLKVSTTLSLKKKAQHVTKQQLRRVYKQEAKGIYDNELIDEIIYDFMESLNERWTEFHGGGDERTEENVQQIEELLDMLGNANTPQEKMIAIDHTINKIHFTGKYGDYVIKDLNDDYSFFDELSNLKVSSLNLRKISQTTGMLKLIHYSPDADLEVINPEYMGTSSHAGEEMKNTTKATPKTSNWYIVGSKELIEIHRFGNYHVYSVEVPDTRLFNADSGEGALDLKQLKDNGYLGFTRYGQARLFEPVSVKYEGKSKISAELFGKGKVTGENALDYVVSGWENPEHFTGKNSPLRNTQYIILTAENPGGQALTEEENSSRNSALIEKLKSAGYTPIPVEGSYGGNIEHSYLVPNMFNAEALQYAQEFGQESVLTPKGLLYRDGTVAPADLSNINFESGQSDFYSKINVGDKEIKFSIPIDFENKLSLTDPKTESDEESNKETVSNLSLRKKYAQIDRQLFFDFYGVSLLSDQYLDANPYAKEYKDMIVNEVKNVYVPLITKMVYAELSKHLDRVTPPNDAPGSIQTFFNFKKVKDLTLEQLADVYYEGDWEESFGGSSWGNIVDSLIELINTTDTNQLITVIDHINDIEHNTGLMFHDFPKVKKWFSDALDMKAKALPEQLILYLSNELRKLVIEDLHLRGQEITTDIKPLTIMTTEQKAEFSTNPEELKELSKHKNWKVRAAVAANGYTLADTLIYLSEDEDVNVWWALLDNPSIPPEIMKKVEEKLEDLNRATDLIACNLNFRKKYAQLELEADIWTQYPISKEKLKRLYIQENNGIYDEELEDEIILKFINTLNNFWNWLEYIFGKGNLGYALQVSEIKGLIEILENAKTPQEKMIAIDRVINAIHKSGKYIEYLIENGNVEFLNELSNLKISSFNFKNTSNKNLEDFVQKFVSGIGDDVGSEEFQIGNKSFLIHYEGWSPGCFPEDLSEEQWEEYAEEESEKIIKEWEDIEKRNWLLIPELSGYVEGGLYGRTFAVFSLKKDKNTRLSFEGQPTDRNYSSPSLLLREDYGTPGFPSEPAQAEVEDVGEDQWGNSNKLKKHRPTKELIFPDYNIPYGADGNEIKQL